MDMFNCMVYCKSGHFAMIMRILNDLQYLMYSQTFIKATSE